MSNLRLGILKRVRSNARDVTAAIYSDLQALGSSMSGRILDVGCGTKPYRGLFGHASFYTGIDLPREVSTNRLAKDADVFGDIAHLPFATAAFDAAICTQVLEHVSDPGVVILEISRVLRPGGHVVLTIPFAAAEHEEPHDYFRFTQFGIRSLLEANGFEVAEIRKQFGFWSAIGEMVYWHFHRKVQGSWLEKYWYAAGTTVFLRMFHLLNWLDPDDKLALNLCVTARRKIISTVQLQSEEKTPLRLSA